MLGDPGSSVMRPVVHTVRGPQIAGNDSSTATQERAMLTEWRRLVPSPVMDYTYGWSNQSSANPTLVDSPALQKVFATFFATGT